MIESHAAIAAQGAAVPAASFAQATPLLLTIGAYAVALGAIATVVTLLYKLLTRDLGRDVADAKRDVVQVEHKVRNVSGRIDALEHLRITDIERIVRVETSITGVEKSLDRIEKTIGGHFDQLASSIREIRHVEPRRG